MIQLLTICLPQEARGRDFKTMQPHQLLSQAFACRLVIDPPWQVLGHLGFDFEDEGVPLQQETGPDRERPPTNDDTTSRVKSEFCSWGGASSMSFQVGLGRACRTYIQSVFLQAA